MTKSNAIYMSGYLILTTAKRKKKFKNVNLCGPVRDTFVNAINLKFYLISRDALKVRIKIVS